jgi:hypothetical protein
MAIVLASNQHTGFQTCSVGKLNVVHFAAVLVPRVLPDDMKTSIEGFDPGSE